MLTKRTTDNLGVRKPMTAFFDSSVVVPWPERTPKLYLLEESHEEVYSPAYQSTD